MIKNNRMAQVHGVKEEIGDGENGFDLILVAAGTSCKKE